MLERRTIGTMSVDLCGACRALWFDAFESAQLTSNGAIALFRAIHESTSDARAALPQSMRCPRCGEPLQLTHDLQHTTRFSYHRCPYGHGRFTPFFQFLREKSLVRPLGAEELARLKQAVRVVRCPGCGAPPVDLATMTACAYCHAPIEILDADAVAKTLAELAAAHPAARTVDADVLAQQFAAAQRADAASRPAFDADVYDLMGAGVGVLLSLWSR